MPPGGMDWPTAVTILGAITLVIGAFLRYFKRDFAWKEPFNELELRVIALEATVKNLEDRLSEGSKSNVDRSQNLSDRIDKVEQKIEKLTDILIKYISERGH